jgi:hypothetical protein
MNKYVTLSTNKSATQFMTRYVTALSLAMVEVEVAPVDLEALLVAMLVVPNQDTVLLLLQLVAR